MRPHQWVKNMLVFVPILTSHALLDLGSWWGGLQAFAAFSAAASGIYLVNDLLDLAADRAHSAKRHRPFASGAAPLGWGIGLGAALDYMRGVGLDSIAAHEAALRDRATERLSEINSLRIFGRAKHKGAIVSFNMEGAHAHDIATVIDRAGVAVRAGTHCTQPLLQRFGVTATCRASFAMYNTLEEVEVLAEALISARRIFG